MHFEFGKLKFQPNDWLKQVKAYNQEYEYTNEVSDGTLLNWSVDKTERYADWIYNHLMPEKYKDERGNGDTGDLSVMERRLFQIFTLEGVTKELDIPKLVMDNEESFTPKLKTLKNIMDYSKVDKLLFTLLSKAINVSTTELNSIYESTIKHFTKKAR